MKTSIAPMVIGLLLSAACGVFAQTTEVGYPPTQSPYHDLEWAQEFTIIGGEYHAHRDPVHAGPQPGTLVGVHYEWRPGGPAHLVAEVARASSDRLLINPDRSGTARDLGTTSRPLYMADFDLGMSLTGAKSWHRLVPEVLGGIGAVSDFRTLPDSGGFRFGTRFAFNFGGGLRYVPHGRWQIRADLKDRLYSMAYPATYFVAPAGGTAVVPASQPKSFWMHNPAYTLGLSYLF